MAVNSYKITINYGGQNPNGVTTGHNQAAAGEGRHLSFAKFRAAARRGVPQDMHAAPVPLAADRVGVFVASAQAAQAQTSVSNRNVLAQSAIATGAAAMAHRYLTKPFTG